MANLGICLLICLSLSACASTKIANMDTSGTFELFDDEARLWKRSKELEDILNKSGYIYQDEQLTKYVNDVLHKVTSELEASNKVNLKVYILKDPFFNAFCLPDGVIYVHTSILANADNEAQLATLLGHEASHFFCRHSLKEQRSIINKSAFLSALSVTLTGTGGYGSLADILAQYVVVGSVFGYSRGLENEADKKGFELMEKAGYDPKEAKKFLENLYEANKDDDKIPYFYSTHPTTKARVKSCEKLISGFSKENNGEIGGVINDNIYNKMIKNVLLDNAELDLTRQKGIKTARRQIEKYNTLYPGDSRAYCLLGKSYILENNKAKAEEIFKKSLEFNPSYAQAHRELGLLYYKDGKKEDARIEFKEYLRLKPDAEDDEYIRRYLDG